jgi:hypothetical protein
MCKDEIRELRNEFFQFKNNEFKHTELRQENFEEYVKEKFEIIENKISNKYTIVTAIVTIVLILLK